MRNNPAPSAPPLRRDIPRDVSPAASAPAGFAAGTFASGSTGTAIRYLETSPIRVRGPVTGRFYQFSASQPTQAVDPRDVDHLLRTRYFRRV